MLKKLNIFKRWRKNTCRVSREEASSIFRFKYSSFKELLDSNAELSKIIADIEEKLQHQQIFGMSYVRSQAARAVFYTFRMVKSLNVLSSNRYPALYDILEDINSNIKEELEVRKENPLKELILPYSAITKEMVDWVGGKNANLGEILNGAKLPIPQGFAVTTHAFDVFFAHNDLVDEINKKKMELEDDTPEILNRVSEDIQRMILTAQVPEVLKQAILSAHKQMAERHRQSNPSAPPLKVALRSSAVGEDSELSFAGQYVSMLNVPVDHLEQTYKIIVASLYTPRAISYRLNKGIRDEDNLMSVACLQMVDSVASGVVYSRHPFNIMEEDVIITAVWGLGPYAVDGVITPDSYTVAKDENLSILETKVSHKPVQLAMNPGGGLVEIPVEDAKQDQPCLSAEQTKTLAGYAVALEKHYGCPQDMEWALDREGNLLVLQTRPLHLEGSGIDDLQRTTPKLTQYPILLEGGTVAFPGVGCGPAFHVRSGEDLASFPDGAVLVAKHSSPKFVIVMKKAQAIVTDAGSVTGHMASLAREFAVPCVMNMKMATNSIPPNALVTVDAYSARIYEGRVPELMDLKVSRESGMKDTPVYETLKRVAGNIIPLNVVDPKSPSFVPEACRSLHDIMRLVHEFSYSEMFQLSDLVSDKDGCAVKLDVSIPLDLHIIDLGGGLLEGDDFRKKVTPNQVVSIPFKALLKGMLHKDLQFRGPRPIELGGLLSVMSEQMLSSPKMGGERFGDRSYAIISDKYLNFSSRIGYHYSILDSYCGQTMNKNYITFSFKGGAADDIRRNRRARSIAAMLQALDFTTTVVADRVDARFQKYEQSVMEEKLDMLGRLLQFTRQMDMLMTSEASVQLIARSFLEGNYSLEAV